MDEIRRAKIRRLQLLRLRRARQGYHTPPDVLMEIEDTAGELGGARVATGRRVMVDRDLGEELVLLARNFNRFMVISMVGTSSALIIAIADFVLILALLGP